MIRTIHPFPARMAPELALQSLTDLPEGSVVLDPMAGSGTVIRQAAELGHQSIGFDMDPLAVLMSRVWTTSVDDALVDQVCDMLIDEARSLRARDVVLPWIDEDEETKAFINYWFGKAQQRDLRKLAYVLDRFSKRRFSKSKHAAADVLRIALSRIIVTKEQSASLARDTSHSRPHKVTEESDYDVLEGLVRSLSFVRKRIKESPPSGDALVRLGDARSLKSVKSKSVDAVLTSPPYLNAIDYLRGHRMSLVWLGHRIEDLRGIRSNSIGAERAPDRERRDEKLTSIQSAMCKTEELAPRFRPIVARYSNDLLRMMSEIARVTKTGGSATFVVGDSCLKGTFIENSAGVARAAELSGFRKLKCFERSLPTQSRYLPMTNGGALGKRMRTETIITLERL